MHMQWCAIQYITSIYETRLKKHLHYFDLVILYCSGKRLILWSQLKKIVFSSSTRKPKMNPLVHTEKPITGKILRLV